MSNDSCPVTEARAEHRVAVMVDEGTNPFELGVATEAFGLERSELGWQYQVSVCGPGPVACAAGMFTITPSEPTSAAAEADTLIVPGHPDPGEPAPPEMIEVIRAAQIGGARIVSFCSGALVLAEARVLDGLEATTHWMYTDLLAGQFPAVKVRPDVLYVDQAPVYTAAGSAAALDLSLHLIGVDHGAAVQAAVARRMVFAAQRAGDQRQFFDPPPAMSHGAPNMADLESYVAEHLDRNMTVATLADHLAMSVTSFHRWFKAQTGLTPLRWVTIQRVARARSRLETSDDTVERIAIETGFGTSNTLRTHFARQLGMSPTRYRDAHAARAAAGFRG